MGIVQVLTPHHRDNVDIEGVNVGVGDVDVQNKGLTPQEASNISHWLVYNHKGYAADASPQLFTVEEDIRLAVQVHEAGSDQSWQYRCETSHEEGHNDGNHQAI